MNFRHSGNTFAFNWSRSDSNCCAYFWIVTCSCVFGSCFVLFWVLITKKKILDFLRNLCVDDLLQPKNLLFVCIELCLKRARKKITNSFLELRNGKTGCISEITVTLMLNSSSCCLRSAKSAGIAEEGSWRANFLPSMSKLNISVITKSDDEIQCYFEKSLNSVEYPISSFATNAQTKLYYWSIIVFKENKQK